MRFLNDPRTLIVFAGDLLWPQLDAFAQWFDELQAIHILPAFGEEEPEGSADRLAQFCRDYLPHVMTHVLDPVPADDPTPTREAITAIATSGEPMLMDASGGSRMMFLGAVLAANEADNLRLIYREPPEPWYEITPEGAIRELRDTVAWAADRFTVQGLLDVTWSDEARTATVLPTVVDERIDEAARATIDGAEWRLEFEKLRQHLCGKGLGAGHLFEQYVLCLLRQLGVQADDVALSAVLFDGSKAVQEVDVVVNSNGRLHVIDCKLADEGQTMPIGVQVRDAYATRRHLGDDADQYILLRPNMTIQREFRDLCAAYDIRVVDEKRLAEEPLVDVLRTLIRPSAKTTASPGPARSVRLPITRGLLDLDCEFLQSRERVRLYDHGHVFVLRLAPGHGVRKAHVVKQVTEALRELGTVTESTQNTKRTNFTLVITPFSDQRQVVRERLAALPWFALTRP